MGIKRGVGVRIVVCVVVPGGLYGDQCSSIQFNINRLVVRESSKYLVLLHEYFHAFIIKLFSDYG